MNRDASIVRERLAQAEREFTAAKAAVDALERQCVHAWGMPVSDPLVQPGYHDTPPWAHRGLTEVVWIPERVTPRWKRTCSHCGKTEHTMQTTERIEREPRFAT